MDEHTGFTNTLDQPVLYGYSVRVQGQELKNVKEVARFIYEQGRLGDVQILTEEGAPFISTMGFFLDRIASMEYREALLKELVPLQMGIEEDEQCCKMDMMI